MAEVPVATRTREPMPKSVADAAREPSGSSLAMPVSPGARWRSGLAVLAAAVAVLGLGGWWQWVELGGVEAQRLVAGEVLDAAGPALGFVIVPELPPPPTPAEQLEARLSAFARHIEAIRAKVEPPLVAFGAEDLREQLERVVARVDDRAQVSVHIRDLDSGRILFDYYGDTPLNPASNHKLLTTAAALDLLGADYVFETRVLLAGESLYLIGEGDPTIDAEVLAGLATEVAERVPAGAITRIVVDDSAFSPRSFGPGYAEDSGSGPAYMAPSGALSLNFNTVEVTVYPVKGASAPGVRVEPASAHVVVDNRARIGAKTLLDVRSHRAGPTDGGDRERVRTRLEVEGTITRSNRGTKVRRRVVDPGSFTGGAFAQMLAAASQSEVLPVEIGRAPAVDLDALAELDGDGDHVELPMIVGFVDGGERAELAAETGDPPSEGSEVLLIARRQSPPLLEIVGGLLTYSNNFMAEQILRTLGWRMTGDPGDWDNGSAVIRGYWAALGNDPDALVFENGSGLSEVGRVTTAGLVDLMAMAARTQAAGASLFDALPVAGTVGTVRTRLRRSKKRVRAKTGTLDGVSGLTGVITSEDGTPQVAFSIIINVKDSDRMAAATRRKVEDQIVMAVLDHIDGWEAIRGTVILDLPPLPVTPGEPVTPGFER